MFGKTSGYFFLLVLLLDPSSAFLTEKCNIDLDRLEKLLKQHKVSPRLVLEAAQVLLGIFTQNTDLAKEYPSIKEFVKLLVRQGSKIVNSRNLAFFGATVYLGAVVVTSYCFLVHSQEQLAEVLVLGKKLDVIIDGEVKPILRHIEMLLNGGGENGLTNACNMKVKAMGMLKERRLKIQNIIHMVGNIKMQRIGKLPLLWLSTALIPSVFRAFLAPVAVPSVELLEKMEDKAFEVEKAITMLQTNLGIACRLGFRNLESEFRWNLMLEAEERKVAETDKTEL